MNTSQLRTIADYDKAFDEFPHAKVVLQKLGRCGANDDLDPTLQLVSSSSVDMTHVPVDYMPRVLELHHAHGVQRLDLEMVLYNMGIPARWQNLYQKDFTITTKAVDDRYAVTGVATCNMVVVDLDDVTAVLVFLYFCGQDIQVAFTMPRQVLETGDFTWSVSDEVNIDDLAFTLCYKHDGNASRVTFTLPQLEAASLSLEDALCYHIPFTIVELLSPQHKAEYVSLFTDGVSHDNDIVLEPFALAANFWPGQSRKKIPRMSWVKAFADERGLQCVNTIND